MAGTVGEEDHAPSTISDPTVRDLLQQLMHHGWYRAGAGTRQDDGRPMWGFREGQVTREQPDRTLWIAAADEREAMRLLLGELTNRREQRTHGQQRRNA